ncbi:MAG: succinate dehydrogenase [Dehalococcoidia bacterium]|nr:succinate dehydrogenase [Dehalococcoidia bacterium]
MAQAAGTTRRVRNMEAIQRRYGQTHRQDNWQQEPLLIILGLGAFAVYTTISALLGDYWPFEAGIDPATGHATYLSPYFEPLFRFEGLPKWFSPAIWILWAPLSFRTTCYYYRRSYYRAFFRSPPGCAVAEPAQTYTGETNFPLVLQNLHRYAMYVAIVFPIFLFYGAFKSFWFGGHIGGEFGIGVGSIILTINAVLLTLYTIGCHSFRHFVAGGLNQFTASPFRMVRRRLWEIFTIANENHRRWAWISMIFVGVADLYVHLVAGGIITDLNTWSQF